MRDHELPLDDLGDLAREEMRDKVREVGNPAQAEELYDVPAQTDAQLAAEQESETRE